MRKNTVDAKFQSEQTRWLGFDHALKRCHDSRIDTFSFHVKRYTANSIVVLGKCPVSSYVFAPTMYRLNGSTPSSNNSIAKNPSPQPTAFNK